MGDVRDRQESYRLEDKEILTTRDGAGATLASIHQERTIGHGNIVFNI